MDPMITVDEAERILIDQFEDFNTVETSIDQCLGQVLREDLYADREQPPFDRVAMDGIAISFDAYQKGLRLFKRQGIHPAGHPAPQLNDPSFCFEVMTGAVLPQGCNCVIPYEQLKEQADHFEIVEEKKIKEKGNIHPQGSDCSKNELMLPQGLRLQPSQLAIAASVGKSLLNITQWPSATIIATGQELVAVDQTPQPWEIRSSNLSIMKAYLQQCGLTSITTHLVADNPKLLENTISTALQNSQLILLSGGVSKGKYDYIPDILKQLSVAKLFHRIQQRPGKPMWAGKGPQQQIVLALPGNPWSSLMCLRRYALPLLEKKSKLNSPQPLVAELSEDISFKPNLRFFLPVLLKQHESRLIAFPNPPNGSGDFKTPALSDGFLEIKEGKELYPKGSDHRLWPLKEL